MINGRKILGLFILMGGALVVLFGCGGESEKSTTPASVNEAIQDGPPLGDFQDSYGQMVKRLDLSAEESASLKAAWQQHLNQMESWWAQHGKALAKYEEELKQGAKDRDLSALRRAKAKADPLSNEFRALVRAGEVGVLMSLPPKQRIAWDAEQLMMKLEELIAERIELNPEQKAVAQALAQKNAAAADPDLSVQNRLGQPFLDFERELENTVMTPEQRTIYAQLKDENKFRSLRW